MGMVGLVEYNDTISVADSTSRYAQRFRELVFRDLMLASWYYGVDIRKSISEVDVGLMWLESILFFLDIFIESGFLKRRGNIVSMNGQTSKHLKTPKVNTIILNTTTKTLPKISMRIFMVIQVVLITAKLGGQYYVWREGGMLPFFVCFLSASGYAGSSKYDQYLKVSSKKSLYFLPLPLSKMSQAQSPSM